MYVYIQAMSKTIMVSDEAYEKLKNLKNGKSFSEVIIGLTGLSKPKTVDGLMECFGSIPDDEEWRELKRIHKRGWKNWGKGSV